MKILVCNSTSCISSNFIRYVLYRSKDFNFISFDALTNLSDYKKVYRHNKHKFYIGDSNKEFLERLVFVEKPDIIISSLYYNRDISLDKYSDVFQQIVNITKLNIPIVYIGPPINSEYNNVDIFKAIKTILFNHEYNTYIEIPNLFGLRQNNLSSFYWLIKLIINDKIQTIYADGQIKPWVYLEDLASFIWYIIENKHFGHVKMPALGWISEFQIAEYINNFFKYNCEIIMCDSKSGIEQYDKMIKTEWVPDSKCLEYAIQKTLKWYNVNRWAIDI